MASLITLTGEYRWISGQSAPQTKTPVGSFVSLNITSHSTDVFGNLILKMGTVLTFVYFWSSPNKFELIGIPNSFRIWTKIMPVGESNLRMVFFAVAYQAQSNIQSCGIQTAPALVRIVNALIHAPVARIDERADGEVAVAVIAGELSLTRKNVQKLVRQRFENKGFAAHTGSTMGQRYGKPHLPSGISPPTPFIYKGYLKDIASATIQCTTSIVEPPPRAIWGNDPSQGSKQRRKAIHRCVYMFTLHIDEPPSAHFAARFPVPQLQPASKWNPKIIVIVKCQAKIHHHDDLQMICKPSADRLQMSLMVSET
ncbi:hypothetical protein DFH08DRAFT_813104 [Mycena albidolilacea]|uniref:Uncharacterized protein n=1 Tax=Mycena albidolilacea TaxID=1033008 RepID=A0AAD6ZTF3_9AGAR|nr:hypothetical protein DFH08DRAFT_813104 [Mycena albidolilacea]